MGPIPHGPARRKVRFFLSAETVVRLLLLRPSASLENAGSAAAQEQGQRGFWDRDDLESVDHRPGVGGESVDVGNLDLKVALALANTFEFDVVGWTSGSLAVALPAVVEPGKRQDLLLKKD